MPKSFDKKIISVSDFLKATKDSSEAHTEGDYKTKDAKGSDRNPKDVIMEMVSTKHVIHEEAKKRLLADGYTDEDIEKMSEVEFLSKSKSSKKVVESRINEMTSPKGAIATEAMNRLRKAGFSDDDINKMSYEEKVAKARDLEPVNESLSNEDVIELKNKIEEKGARNIALAMINKNLGIIAGISTNDLPDTQELADGLDNVEYLLNDNEYHDAWEYAKQTAENMLYDLGFNTSEDEDIDFEGINEKYDTQQRKNMAKSGVAMSDGSFPIRNREDLVHAIKDQGRTFAKVDSGREKSIKSHIHSRAKALGVELHKTEEGNWGINEAKDKSYNKSVDAYQFYIVNIETKKVESGWEYRDDAKDALSDFDGDKKYKIMSKSALKSAGIENPNEKWKQ